MKIFLDSADTEEIRRLSDCGLVDGITTNPTIIAKSGRQFEETIEEICTIVSGPVSCQVYEMGSPEDMIAQGQKMAKLHPNVVVKLPLTMDGLVACRALTHKHIRTNITLCFSIGQALLAAKVGATYISPFVGRLDDINQDGMQLITDIRAIYDQGGFDTQVLAASIRTVNHVTEAALAGADVATVPPSVLRSMVKHPLTDKGLAQFQEDWNAYQQRAR